MKFAHLSDLHIGGWREPKMREANLQAFSSAVKKIIEEKVDFVVISGDLFNTAVPSIDSLRTAVEKLKELKEAGIPVYLIPGSHDFSPSGKTIIDIIETAGFAINVSKPVEKNGRLELPFLVDEKTGVKIAGLQGKKGQLDQEDFLNLNKEPLEKALGKKIFLFHTTVKELLTSDFEIISSIPAGILPKGFDYYAGGHIHTRNVVDVPGLGKMVYPGPVFPNSFSEIEKLRYGSFVIWEHGLIRQELIKVKPVVFVEVNADGKSSSEIERELRKKLERERVEGAIVAIKLKGVLEEGKPSDIAWPELFSLLYGRGAYFVMKNTNALEAKELEMHVQVEKSSVEEIEERVIKELSGNSNAFQKGDEEKIAKALLTILAMEKEESERASDFETRLRSDVDRVFGLEEKDGEVS